MDELVKRRFEYMNAVIDASLRGKPDQIEKYTDLIRDLDLMVSKHLDKYWSNIQLIYVKK